MQWSLVSGSLPEASVGQAAGLLPTVRTNFVIIFAEPLNGHLARPVQLARGLHQVAAPEGKVGVEEGHWDQTARSALS